MRSAVSRDAARPRAVHRDVSDLQLRPVFSAILNRQFGIHSPEDLPGDFQACGDANLFGHNPRCNQAMRIGEIQGRDIALADVLRQSQSDNVSLRRHEPLRWMRRDQANAFANA